MDVSYDEHARCTTVNGVAVNQLVPTNFTQSVLVNSSDPSSSYTVTVTKNIFTASCARDNCCRQYATCLSYHPALSLQAPSDPNNITTPVPYNCSAHDTALVKYEWRPMPNSLNSNKRDGHAKCEMYKLPEHGGDV